MKSLEISKTLNSSFKVLATGNWSENDLSFCINSFGFLIQPNTTTSGKNLADFINKTYNSNHSKKVAMFLSGDIEKL